MSNEDICKKITKCFFFLLFFCTIISSCGTTRMVGQDDIDRINHNEKQFNRDMKEYW